MTQGKLIAMWAVAMIVLAGVYFYATRTPVPEPGKSPDANGMGSTTADETRPEPVLGAHMIPVKGTWISPDNKDPDMKGKVVLLDFWGITCPPCRAAIPSNNTLFEKYASKGFLLAGLTVDKKVQLDDFKKSVDVRYPLLATPVETFMAYGIEIMPTTYLYDRGGKLVWKGHHLADEKGAPLPDFEKALTAALQ